MLGPLIFEEPTHTFWREGLVVPSVTQVIKAAGLMRDYSPTLTWARDRGVRVHAAMFELTQTSEDAALALLDVDDVPYFAAAQAWMATSGVEVIGAEELVDGGSYAGWRDLRCRIRGVKRDCVVDLKTGALPPWVGLQLAAYALPLPNPHDRYAVRVLPDGTFRVQHYPDANDRADFLACLRVVQLQRRYGRSE